MGPVIPVNRRQDLLEEKPPKRTGCAAGRKFHVADLRHMGRCEVPVAVNVDQPDNDHLGNRVRLDIAALRQQLDIRGREIEMPFRIENEENRVSRIPLVISRWKTNQKNSFFVEDLRPQDEFLDRTIVV